MYYEEKVIETVHGKCLAHRSSPDGKWVMFQLAELTKKYEDLRFAAFNLANTVEDYLVDPNFVDDPLVVLEDDMKAVRKAM